MLATHISAQTPHKRLGAIVEEADYLQQELNASRTTLDIAAMAIDPATILVALPDPREVHIESLLNSPVLDTVAAALDAHQLADFTRTLLTTRQTLPDAAWVASLSRFLVHAPALLDALLQLLGWFGDELFDALNAYASSRVPLPILSTLPLRRGANIAASPSVGSAVVAAAAGGSDAHDRASTSTSSCLNGEYLDHPSYHVYQDIDIVAVRAYPLLMNELVDRYPQFFEAVRQYLIEHRRGVEDYDRFLELFFLPQQQLSDDDWKSKAVDAYIGPVPKLMCDLREIVALELGCVMDNEDDATDNSSVCSFQDQYQLSHSSTQPDSNTNESVINTTNTDIDVTTKQVAALIITTPTKTTESITTISTSTTPITTTKEFLYHSNSAKLIEAYQRLYANGQSPKDLESRSPK